MPYCSRCGVEVDPGVEKCPLCNTPIQKLEDISEIKVAKKYPDEPIEESSIKRRTEKEKRLFALEIVSISLALPFLITTFLDLIINKSITWARFPMLGFLFIWGTVAIPLLFPKKPIILVLGEVSFVMGFLALVDYFDDWKLEWYVTYALPIVIVTILFSSLVVLASILVKKKGANIAAFILFGIGGLTFCLEIIISRTISWSLFVLTPTVVIGLFLIYLHYRFTKDIDIKDKLKEKLQI